MDELLSQMLTHILLPALALALPLTVTFIFAACRRWMRDIKALVWSIGDAPMKVIGGAEKSQQQDARRVP